MFPVLAIAGARMARNLIQSANQGAAPAGQPQTNAPNPAEFQALLQKVSASPQVQKASFLNSEGIHNVADAEKKLADYGATILQDPAIQTAMAENSDAIELRFLPNGSVSIKTSDGQQKTVTLQGDAKEAARKGSLVIGSLQTANLARPTSTDFLSKPMAPGIKIMPGAGSASVLL